MGVVFILFIAMALIAVAGGAGFYYEAGVAASRAHHIQQLPQDVIFAIVQHFDIKIKGSTFILTERKHILSFQQTSNVVQHLNLEKYIAIFRKN